MLDYHSLLTQMATPGKPLLAKKLATLFIHSTHCTDYITKECIPDGEEKRIPIESGVFHVGFRHQGEKSHRMGRCAMMRQILLGDPLLRQNGLAPAERIGLDHLTQKGVNGLHKALLSDIRRDLSDNTHHEKHRYMDLLLEALSEEKITEEEFREALNAPIPATAINSILQLKGSRCIQLDMKPREFMGHFKTKAPKIQLDRVINKLDEIEPMSTASPEPKCVAAAPSPEQEETPALLPISTVQTEFTEAERSALFEAVTGSDYGDTTTLELVLFEIEIEKQQKETPTIIEVSPDGKEITHINKLDTVRNTAEDTLLHIAARQGNWPLAKQLLDWGANPFTKNKSGDTPLDIMLRYPIHTTLTGDPEAQEKRIAWHDCCQTAISRYQQAEDWPKRIDTIIAIHNRLFYYAEHPDDYAEASDLIIYDIDLLNSLKDSGLSTTPFLDPYTQQHPKTSVGNWAHTCLANKNYDALTTFAAITLPGLWHEQLDSSVCENHPIPFWSVTDKGDESNIKDLNGEAKLSPIEVAVTMEDDEGGLQATELVLVLIAPVNTDDFCIMGIWGALRRAAYFAKPNTVRLLLTHESSADTLATPTNPKHKNQRKIALEYAKAGYKLEPDNENFIPVLALLSGYDESSVLVELGLVKPEPEPEAEPEPEVEALAAAVNELESPPLTPITPTPPPGTPPPKRRPQRGRTMFSIRDRYGNVITQPTKK